MCAIFELQTSRSVNLDQNDEVYLQARRELRFGENTFRVISISATKSRSVSRSVRRNLPVRSTGDPSAQNWSLRASYGYIDAEYDNYIADITGDGIITDNSNLIPRNTPENTFGVITTYDANIGPGTLQTSLSYRYRDTVEIEASNAPFGHMDSINDLSGSISYLWSDNRYRLTVYGKNLTDDQELGQSTIAPLTTRGWWTPPRTVGAEFAISF